MKHELASKFCPHCHAKIVSYTHSLKSGKLVKALIKFANIVSDTEWVGNPGEKIVGLTINEYNNFQKLQYWDLVERMHCDGLWSITETGQNFLSGFETVPVNVTTYRGHVTNKSEDLITIRQFLSSPEQYMKRIDYAESADTNHQLKIKETLQI